MGCIEITYPQLRHHQNHQINRNMGCIEMVVSVLDGIEHIRLIETWDVLKLAGNIGSIKEADD